MIFINIIKTTNRGSFFGQELLANQNILKSLSVRVQYLERLILRLEIRLKNSNRAPYMFSKF